MSAGLCECGCGFPTKIAPWNGKRDGWIKGKPLRFIRGHQRRKSPVAFVVDPDTGCWNWQRTRGKDGYGRKRVGSRKVPAHRYFYEILVGPIPDGLTLDHLCRNRACVNPDHLEPTSRGENVLRGEGIAAANARKTHCKRGHPFNEANTHTRPNGARRCRVCDRERAAA